MQHQTMAFVFSNISPMQVMRILRPNDVAAAIRKKYNDAQNKADEEAAIQQELSDAVENAAAAGGEGSEGEGEVAQDDTVQSSSSTFQPTAEEVVLMEEHAFDDPAEEAERRSGVIRSLVFGEDTQLGEEFGDDEERTSVLVEFLVGCVHFAEKSKFTDEQVSVVFAVAERLFSFARSPPSQEEEGKIETTSQRHKWAPRAETYVTFTNMLRQHAVPDPKSNLRTFSAIEVDIISEFFGTTFFRHYKAYEYSFTVERRIVTTAVDVVVGTPTTIPSLAQAKEIIMTDAEKREQAEESKKTSESDEDMAKQQALDAAEAALESLEAKEGQKEDGAAKDENAGSTSIDLDDRLLREIQKRVTAQTQALQDEIRDLKETTDTLMSLEEGE